MARKKSIKLPSKKVIVIAAAVVVVGVAAALAYHFTHDSQPSVATPATTAASKSKPANSYVNLNPATDAEKQQSQNAKAADLAQQNQASTDPSTPKSVTVTIANADATSVRGHVDGIVEIGGTCTAIFSKDGSATQKFTSTGSADASNTNCPPIAVSGLTSGTWSLVLSYSSSTASGSSSAQNVVVP